MFSTPTNPLPARGFPSLLSGANGPNVTYLWSTLKPEITCYATNITLKILPASHGILFNHMKLPGFPAIRWLHCLALTVSGSCIFAKPGEKDGGSASCISPCWCEGDMYRKKALRGGQTTQSDPSQSALQLPIRAVPDPAASLGLNMSCTTNRMYFFPELANSVCPKCMLLAPDLGGRWGLEGMGVLELEYPVFVLGKCTTPRFLHLGWVNQTMEHGLHPPSTSGGR